MHLIIANNIVANNLVNAVRTGKEQKCTVHAKARIRFKIISESCDDFSEFDLAVLSYINGVWADKSNTKNTFTITSLCRALGCCASGSVSPVMRTEVEASLNRLCSIHIGMDVEQDFAPHRKTYMQDNQSQTWEQATGVRWQASNPLIVLESTETTIPRSGPCGNIHNVMYTVMQEPLLYTYSTITGQFVTIPADRMRIHDVDDQGNLTGAPLPMTKSRIAETFWCARQVERMRYAIEHPQRIAQSKKGKKKRNFIPQKDPKSAETTILLATVFDRAGIAKRDASRHKKRHIEYLQTVMSCWAAQGIIPAWEFRTTAFGHIDAIVLFPGAATFPEQATPAPDPVPSPEIDAIFGARDTIMGAIDAIFGAPSEPLSAQKMRLQSLLKDICQEMARILKYPKYFSLDTPALL